MQGTLERAKLELAAGSYRRAVGSLWELVEAARHDPRDASGVLEVASAIARAPVAAAVRGQAETLAAFARACVRYHSLRAAASADAPARSGTPVGGARGRAIVYAPPVGRGGPPTHPRARLASDLVVGLAVGGLLGGRFGGGAFVVAAVLGAVVHELVGAPAA